MSIQSVWRHSRCTRQITLGLVLVLCLVGASYLAGRSTTGHAQSPPPAALSAGPSDTLLRQSWTFYKGRFLVDGAHVVSNTYGGTISEGQSYALLKAVWMHDPTVFESVWRWTKTNMARPHDHLLGWRWGDGQFGTTLGLMETDNATDADQDIAYALLLAGKRWSRPDYTRDAIDIIRDLWRLNVVRIGNRYYLTPGTWEGFRREYLTLDPSYFAPYVYREFARYDTAHAAGWTALADGVYDTLEACTRLTATQTPPNWCAVSWNPPAAGKSPVPVFFSDLQGEGARDFSYDAFRVYWRMAMDARLSPPPARERAARYLKRYTYPLLYWQKNRALPEGFAWQGAPRGDGQISGFMAGPALVIAHFQPLVSQGGGHAATKVSNAAAPEKALYQALLSPHYHAEGYWFNDYNDYLHSVIWLHLYALARLNQSAAVNNKLLKLKQDKCRCKGHIRGLGLG